MKILHVCDWYQPFGGAERLLFGMLDVFEEAGHENVVAAHHYPGQTPTSRRPEYFIDDLDLNFANVPGLTALRRRILRLRARLTEIIRKHRPDVAHIHNMQNPFVVRTMTEALPTVRSVHDPRLYCFTDWRLLPNKDLCPHPLGRHCVTEGCLPVNLLGSSNLVLQAPYRFLHLKSHHQVETLIVESEPVRDCLLQNGFPAERITLLPNFTDIHGTWDDICRYNERHYKPGENIVLFVGRASYEKGIDHLMEAMSQVPKPWRLVLVTGGEYLKEAREKIRGLGLEGSVEIPGVLSYELTREWYARADVVAFPSVWIESFGLVGLEAMANGKPVVAYRTGGIPEWMEDGRTGWLVELKDTKALARRIHELLKDPGKARAMGRAGYERVVRLYNKRVYVDGLLDIYRTAISKRASGTTAPQPPGDRNA